ncbi:gamma-aminobutyric acid type B receptor subunit 2-like isoform X2 [Dysidea avara]
MILGTACSVASIIMGEIAERHLNITQVSYAATSPLFGDKERYPRFYCLVPDITQYFVGYSKILGKFNWKKVAVIYYDDDFTLNVGKKFLNYLNNSVEIILNLIFADGTDDFIIRQIKSVNARIVILFIPPSPLDILVNFWCKAIKSKLTGPNFVWLFPGYFQPDWWNVTDSDCSAEEMRNALEHSLAILDNSELTSDASRMLVSNKNVSQFQKDLQSKTAIDSVETDVDIMITNGYIYDAIWTIVLALNSSISILEDRGLGRLENFTYDSVEMANVFTEAVANVSFQGISGNVSFENGNNTQPASLLIIQYQDGDAKPVLVFDPSQTNESDNLRFVSNNSSFIWQGGIVPRDSPFPIVRESSLVEFIIAGVVCSIGILSTIFFFMFNLYYRKHPVVRKSSYRLNSLILVAVLVGFFGTLLHVIKLDDDMSDVVTTTICNARNWTNNLAFVVAFGTLFAKIWRLYRIFANKTLTKRKHLDDQYLLLMVAVIAAPILVVLIVQVAAFPLKLHRHKIINEDDLMTVEIYEDCSGDHEFIFLGVCYIEYVLLALFSILVAYQTQKNIGVYYKHLESAVINLTTILAVLLSSICQVVVIILRINQIQEGVLLVITLRDCLWMFPMIYLLFIPKVYRVKKMPFQFIIKVNESVVNTFLKRKSVKTADFELEERRSSDVYVTHDEKTLETSLNSISNFHSETKVTFSTVSENHNGIEQDAVDVPYHLCDNDTLNDIQLQ